MATIPERTDKSNKTFQGRIIQKHDTEANWKKATNFVPLKGEIIIYDDLRKIKIGDGKTNVNTLNFTADTGNYFKKGNYISQITSGFQSESLYLNNSYGLGTELNGEGLWLWNQDEDRPIRIGANVTNSDKEVFGIKIGLHSDTGFKKMEDITINGVASPIENNDAVNKKYVDDLMANASSSTTIIKTWTEA